MINFICSASKANVMETCWEKYNLEYNFRWTPNNKAEALENGSLVHTVFRHFYKEKLSGRFARGPEEFGTVLEEACQIARRDASRMNVSVQDADETIAVAKENLLYHAQDGMTVYAVEQPFSKVLYEDPNYPGMTNDPEDKGLRIIWEGFVDLVASLPNEPIACWDHKSESRRGVVTKLDNQFQGEVWAFGVETMVVNKVGFQTTLEQRDKFRRIFLDYRGTDLIAEWRRDMILRILEAIELHKREAQGRSQWRRNRRYCRYCAFKQVCEAQPSIRPIKLQTYYHIRDPKQMYEPQPEVEAEVEVNG